MTRESASAKAVRVLAEGRLVVELAAAGVFAATVRGSGDIHHVTYARGGWRCSCPARGRCSHLAACWLIAAPALPRPKEQTS